MIIFTLNSCKKNYYIVLLFTMNIENSRDFLLKNYLIYR